MEFSESNLDQLVIPKNKMVYTVCVDDYFPDLCRLTIPYIAKFAERIGAGFKIISERKFPDFPPTYEKLQIHDIGKNNGWNILVDADMLVSPDFGDSNFILPETSFYSLFMFDASDLFVADEYFYRDGRNLGISANFLIVPHSCHDLWTPLEFGFDVARHRVRRGHCMDEYCISRNVARFGLKLSTLLPSPASKHAEILQFHLDNVIDDKIIHLGASINSRDTILKAAEIITERWAKREITK